MSSSITKITLEVNRSNTVSTALMSTVDVGVGCWLRTQARFKSLETQRERERGEGNRQKEGES